MREPRGGELRNLLERPALLEQVRRARDDLQLPFATRGPSQAQPVQGDDLCGRRRRRSAASATCTAVSARPARSGRPPRDTTAPTVSARRAAAINAAAAPVLAPNSPIRSADVSGCRRAQSMAATRRRPATRCRSGVRRWRSSSVSSAGVSRSIEQRAQSGSLQACGDGAVARAVAAAAAAVREHDQSGCAVWHDEIAVDPTSLVVGGFALNG